MTIEQVMIASDMEKQVSDFTLSEEEKLSYLIKLYQNGDFETIRDNREWFSTLFQDEEKITRK